MAESSYNVCQNLVDDMKVVIQRKCFDNTDSKCNHLSAAIRVWALLLKEQ